MVAGHLQEKKGFFMRALKNSPFFVGVFLPSTSIVLKIVIH